jgi:LysM repeat protein
MVSRNHVLIALLIIVGAVSFALPRASFAQDSGAVHIVRDGETLTSIAAHYHTTIYVLIAANHLKDGDALYVGERLVIPAAQSATGSSGLAAPAASPGTSPGTYVVQPGDTLTRIADQLGVTIDDLMAANKITDPALIRIGQILKIPGASTSVSGPAVPTLADGQQTLMPGAGGPAVQFQITDGHLVSVTLQAVSSGKQELPLSCEAKIASQIATMYGLSFDEESFQNRLPHSLNPQRGFVGDVHGRFYWPADIVGGTASGPGGYGVHVEGWAPTFEALSGFQVRLLASSPAAAQSQIDAALRHGYPVAVWAILGFRPPLARNSLWIGSAANGTAIDCGGPAPGCYYLASGEHAYLILGRQDSDYVVYDPGKGEITTYPRSTVITGITTLFATPTGSAPGGVIIPGAGYTPDLRALPNW